MQKKARKKRRLLWILPAILILLIIIMALPIVTLYVQYHNISYTPSTPIERSDTYVIPDYPEIVIGSENITDFPEDTEVPAETTEIIPETTEQDEVTSESGETKPPETGIETEAQTDAQTEAQTDAETEAGTEAVTQAEETTMPQPETTAPPETLPPVIYVPPETETPTTTKTPTKPPSTPNTESDNSFGNSTNTISVYGKTPIYKVAQKDPNIINILVLGTDSRNVVKDRGRSDTMIVVSYNKKTAEIKMVSFLRDMLVPIEGHDWNRINTAYYFDGVGLAINTINQLFGLDIQHFVVIDFNGAKDFIDYIGGIKLTLTESEAEKCGVTYSKDPILLDGKATLLHMRNRSSDNDFGRTRRQRDVIVAVFNKIISEKSLTEILDITKYAMGMIRTNIPASMLTSLATSIVTKAGSISIESQSLPYRDAFQYAWYKKMAILSFDIKQTAERMLKFLYE